VSEVQENESIGRLVLRRLGSSRRADFALRLTAMIDMVFLLLIFFLVTANLRPAEGFLPFQLPAASAGQAQFGKAVPLTIQIFAVPGGCEVQIGRNHTLRVEQATSESDLAGLAETISGIMERQKRTRDDPVEIICRPDVQWRYWARIYSVLFGLGVKDITVYKTE